MTEDDDAIPRVTGDEPTEPTGPARASGPRERDSSRVAALVLWSRTLVALRYCGPQDARELAVRIASDLAALLR